MADREIKVVINGKEYVSAEADKAGKSVEGLGSRVKNLAKEWGSLIAGSALALFFKSAVDEAAKAEVGMGRLGVAVKNTGNDFDALKPQLEAAVSSVMRMSTATDDDLRAALTNMITVSGDVEGSMANLALVTDLAAFKNVDLETAAISVGKAMNGNTTELNRLGIAGKDSTTVLNNLRESVGGFAANEANTFSGKLQQLNNQWGEFKEAVGKAILSGGELQGAVGGLAGILGNLATWIEHNEAAIGVFKDALVAGGSALFDLGKAIWDVVGPPLTWLAKVAFVAIVAALNTTALGVKRTAGVFQEFAGTAIAAIGSLVEKGGKILKFFGVDVVQKTGTDLKRFGEQMVANGTAAANRAVTEYSAAMGRLGDLIQGNEEKHTEVVSTETGKRTTKRQQGADDATDLEKFITRLTELESKKRSELTQKEADELSAMHLQMAQSREKLAKAGNELLLKTNELLDKQNDKLRGTDSAWGKNHTTVQNYTTSLKDLLPPIEQVKEEVDKNNEALKKNKQTAKDVKDEFKLTVEGAAQIGRSLLDVAQASGVIDRDMGSVLNSVLNIGTSLARIGIDPLGGMVGVLSGLANVITGIGNSEAHKAMRAALATNKDALDRLSREVGNLNLGATGRTVKGTEGALQAVSTAMRAGKLGPDDALGFFRKELLKQGVSRADAEALLKELGFDNALKDSRTFALSLGQLIGGFQNLEFGQFGQDFESQLRAITEGFGIRGITDPTLKLSQLQGLAERFSPALGAALGANDPKSALLALFGKLQTGGLTPGDFGDLSGGQFLDLLKLLLEQMNAGGSILQTGGLDPGTIEDGIGFPSSPPLSGGGGPFGTAPRIGSVTFEGGIHIDLALDPQGESLDDLAPQIAEKVSKELVRRFAAQSAAQGVPI